MPFLDDTDALALWEDGERLSMLDRAVQMAAALAGISINAAGDLPLPVRDRLLLEALWRMGGDSAPVVAPCPDCGTLHEADVALAPLLEARDGPPPQVTIGQHSTDLRPPSSRDLAEAITSGDPSALALRCCDFDAAPSDPAAAQVIEAALEEAFPLLNIQIAMQCDACSTEFARRLDPVPLLWALVTAKAKAALASVDCLARAYGWSEAEIFALSPLRRRRYCEMALQ
ncbi:hypothetical protein [Erythrobacter donghaensis]|uniref:hypothetical protein n=1 Tax=Erythrobacter donghaensis TaxID=267135 RepID=UPI000A360054|nr:hypothetical protein [Erythrobacter donghaensis]